MKKYIGKRIMISLVTLLIIILVLFMLLQLMPGSPFNDEKLTADQIAMMSKKYGLDKPLIVQFFTYVKNLLQGDFGVSYVISKDTSISVLLKNRVPVSFGIGLEAVSFGAVVGLILGILAALKKNSWLDTICTVISVLGVMFWLMKKFCNNLQNATMKCMLKKNWISLLMWRQSKVVLKTAF